MINPSSQKARDRTLLIFIIPIGVLLMLMAGSCATRLAPEWTVEAGMRSNLDLNNLPEQQSAPIQPILPAILTPMSWFETFLTPRPDSGGQVFFPPFVIFEPSATPVVTGSPPTAITPKPSPTPPTSTPPATSSPPPATETSKPPTEEETPTAPPPTPTTPTTPTTPPPTATATGTPTTPPSGYVEVPPPGNAGVNTPPNNVPGNVFPGTYTILDLGGNPVVVSSTPDGKYDLVLYEYSFGSPSRVELDHIIIGISQNPDGSYYEVFNWGDNVRDQNTNVDYNGLPPDPLCPSDPECDNRDIPTTSLYGSPIQSGILIDVDYNTAGKPPEGSYRYVVIICPLLGGDPAQIDSIVVEEVNGGKFGLSAKRTENSQATEEAPPPPQEQAGIPAEEPSQGEETNPPAEESPPVAEESPPSP